VQATDIDTAVDSLLAPAEIETQDTAVEALEQDTEEAEVETEEEEVSEEAESDDEAEYDADADEADADDEDDEDEEDDGDEQPQLHTVKVDGEEVEVTLDDLKRSYSAVGYAQKRMQQAAEARKEAEGLYQTLQLERQQFLATVQNMQQQGSTTSPPKKLRSIRRAPRGRQPTLCMSGRPTPCARRLTTRTLKAMTPLPKPVP
jgi:hypothetical protein